MIPEKPLFLHDVDLDKEDYFLGFFNVGAYQETLGMQHNLFTHPNEYTIHITEDDYEITYEEESKNILDILVSIGYNEDEILNKLKTELCKKVTLSQKKKNVIHLQN